MKTIKEIADLCKVSKTSINRAIKELNIEKTLSGNKNLIDDKDADRIVSMLCGFGKTCAEIKTNQNKTETETEQIKTESEHSSNTDNSVTENNNDNYINFLLEQIKIKDKQIESLHEENKMLIQSNAYTLKQLEELKQIEVKDVNIINDESKEEQNPPETKEKKKRFWFWK